MTHTHQDVQQKLPVAEILFTGFTIITTDGLNITSRPLSGTDMFLLCGYAAETALCVDCIPSFPPHHPSEQLRSRTHLHGYYGGIVLGCSQQYNPPFSSYCHTRVYRICPALWKVALS